MEKRTLVLVRHGQTLSNRLGLIQGRSDVDLSDEGIKQAEELSEKLKAEPFDKAYSSELIRAKRTAEIILDGRNIKLDLDPRLNEIDQGEWTNKSGRELYKSLERYRTWATRPLEAHPPGGETFLQVAERAASFLREFRGEYALAVAHGGLIAVMRSIAGQAHLEKAWSLIPENAETVRLDFD